MQLHGWPIAGLLLFSISLAPSVQSPAVAAAFDSDADRVCADNEGDDAAHGTKYPFSVPLSTQLESTTNRAVRTAVRSIQTVIHDAGSAPLVGVGDDDHFIVTEVVQNAVGKAAYAPAADLSCASPVRHLRPGGRRAHDVQDRGTDSVVEFVTEPRTHFVLAAYRFQQFVGRL